MREAVRGVVAGGEYVSGRGVQSPEVGFTVAIRRIARRGRTLFETGDATGAGSEGSRIVKRTLQAMLSAYKRWISPALPTALPFRFRPARSMRCRQWIGTVALRGSVLAGWRLLRLPSVLPRWVRPGSDELLAK